MFWLKNFTVRRIEWVVTYFWELKSVERDGIMRISSRFFAHYKYKNTLPDAQNGPLTDKFIVRKWKSVFRYLKWKLSYLKLLARGVKFKCTNVVTG